MNLNTTVILIYYNGTYLSDSLEDLLQSPRELARQITLLDFDLLCKITPEDCLNYVIPEQRRGAREGFNEKDAIKLFVDRGNLGKFAYRFGQLSSWVASSVLLFEVLQDRTEALRLFIQTAMVTVAKLVLLL